MELYNVSLVKVGSVELYANSPEEAKKIAEESSSNQIFWQDGMVATNAEKIDKES